MLEALAVQSYVLYVDVHFTGVSIVELDVQTVTCKSHPCRAVVILKSTCSDLSEVHHSSPKAIARTYSDVLLVVYEYDVHSKLE